MTEQISQADIEAAVAEARRQIAEHWGWFLALGIFLIIAGVAAILFPLLSTIATKIVLGWIFLVSGALLVVHAFSAQKWSGFFWGLLLGLLYLAHASPGRAVSGRRRARGHHGLSRAAP